MMKTGSIREWCELAKKDRDLWCDWLDYQSKEKGYRDLSTAAAALDALPLLGQILLELRQNAFGQSSSPTVGFRLSRENWARLGVLVGWAVPIGDEEASEPPPEPELGVVVRTPEGLEGRVIVYDKNGMARVRRTDGVEQWYHRRSLLFVKERAEEPPEPTIQLGATVRTPSGLEGRVLDLDETVALVREGDGEKIWYRRRQLELVENIRLGMTVRTSSGTEGEVIKLEAEEALVQEEGGRKVFFHRAALQPIETASKAEEKPSKPDAVRGVTACWEYYERSLADDLPYDLVKALNKLKDSFPAACAEDAPEEDDYAPGDVVRLANEQGPSMVVTELCTEGHVDLTYFDANRQLQTATLPSRCIIPEEDCDD